MIHRSSPALVLERSPLVLFVAQVRFAEILSMGERLPAVQEGLRKFGFPIFKRAPMQGFVLGSDGIPRLTEIDLWHFDNLDGTSGVILSRDAVTYRSSAYDCYENAQPIFERVLQHVHDVVEIGVLTRCGLRYIDVIYPGEGELFATYLRSEVIGLTESNINVHAISQTSQFTGESEHGRLVVRFTTSISPQYLPPDLAPIELNSSRPSAPNGAQIGTLDFDHFTDRQEEFSVGSAIKHLGELHDAVDQAFKACVTETALKLWGKRDA